MNAAEEQGIAGAATPGPWEVREERGTVVQFALVNPHTGDWPVQAGENDWGPSGGIGTNADAIAIAHARTGYPLALAVVEAAEAMRSAVGEFDFLPRLAVLYAALDAWRAAP